MRQNKIKGLIKAVTIKALSIDQRKPINQIGELYKICFLRFKFLFLTKKYINIIVQKKRSDPEAGVIDEFSKEGTIVKIKIIAKVKKNDVKYQNNPFLCHIT